MPSTRNYLTLNDSVRRNGVSYRPAERLDNAWVLKPVIDGEMVEDDAWYLTDENQKEHRAKKLIVVQEDFFSKAARMLSARNDDSDLTGLDDEKMRDIAWKLEWCTRFNRARAGLDGYDERPVRTPEGFKAFIEGEKDRIHRWYLDTFRMTRPPGRKIAGEKERKFFDYPNPTALRDWLVAYERAEHKQKAFIPKYGNCGNRQQIDGRVLEIIQRHVDEFCSRGGPAKDDIYMAIDDEVRRLNQYLPKDGELTVTERSVRRRIDKLPMMKVDAGRLGLERAGRKYTSVGKGIETYDGLERLERMGRVEMDDWEMDLFAILDEADVRKSLDPKVRKAAKKVDRTVRCTITAGIDVVTRCIVALNVTPHKPSTMGSRLALDSIFVDKSSWARLAGCKTEWPMRAKPREIATDGGPAFAGDFRDSVGRLDITPRYPGGNPTSRGHIESFFRTFKRFCRMFTGQAFANVVKRGDYESEEMASIFVHELELLIVRYIVDEYHQREHAGLSGMRPITAWTRSTNELEDAPDDIQRHAAFGIRRTNLRIQKTGITFMHVQYKHPRMAILHGHASHRDLTGVINPNDLGTILVLVPEEARIGLGGHGDYMEFKAEDFRGVPLARLEYFNDVLLEFEKAEKEDGRSIRHEARRFIKDAAETARDRAGVPSDTMTSEQYLNFLDRMERSSVRATQPRPKPEGAPMSDMDEPDTLGESIARPQGASRLGKPGVVPTPRSINRYRDEERS